MLEGAGVSGAPGLPAVKHVMEVVATEQGVVRVGLTVMGAMLTKSIATLKHAPVSEIFLTPTIHALWHSINASCRHKHAPLCAIYTTRIIFVLLYLCGFSDKWHDTVGTMHGHHDCLFCFLLGPVAATWGDWTSWSECTASCGGGRRSRRRNCEGGNICIGQQTEYTDCNSDSCLQG